MFSILKVFAVLSKTACFQFKLIFDIFSFVYVHEIFIDEEETCEKSIKLLNVKIWLKEFEDAFEPVFVSLGLEVKESQLFKIYQSDLIKNWSIGFFSADKTISSFEAFALKIQICSPGAKTVLFLLRFDTSTNPDIRYMLELISF
jgi:hypothetical protein